MRSRKKMQTGKPMNAEKKPLSKPHRKRSAQEQNRQTKSAMNEKQLAATRTHPLRHVMRKYINIDECKV